MKKNLIWVLIGVAGGVVIGFILTSLLAYNKTAYIDTAKLMEKSIAMKSVKAKMRVQIDKAKANVDTLQIDFEGRMKDYEKKVQVMTEKEKQLAHELLSMKRQELMRYQQAIEAKLSQEEEKMTAEAMKAINDYIAQYGKGHNYKLIFATANGNIAYADESIDITDEIVAGINETVK